MRAYLLSLGLAAGLVAVAMSAASAGTIPYPNTGTINPNSYSFTAESTGTLTAYFYGSSAGDNETLSIYDDTLGTSVTGIFQNHSTATGATATLSVDTGDTLRFTIFDQTHSTTISSVPSANGDGVQHIYSTAFGGGYVGASADDFFGGGATIPAGTYIGFEDTLVGQSSDLNYADEQFVFTDTAISTNGGAAQNTDSSATDTPEPATLMVLGSALAGIGMARRKRRAA